MGNTVSSGVNGRRRRRSHPPPPPHQYVFAAAMTPYLPRYPHARLYSYLQAPPKMAAPYVEHQKVVTVRNEVNVKKESLRIEHDEENPGNYLIAFTFDATVSGRLTVVFFGKEGEDCLSTPMKESLLPSITVEFQKGLNQKFRQASGTGIDINSMFDEVEISEDSDVYPLVVKAEAFPVGSQSVSKDGNYATSVSTNSQITQAVFVKDHNKGDQCHVRVVKQILWVNGMGYELQEIYGIIKSSNDNDFDGKNPGKECVICLSETRDTTVLPCRHMCMCSGCAKVLRLRTYSCPICRQRVERLLQIKFSEGAEQ